VIIPISISPDTGKKLLIFAVGESQEQVILKPSL